MFFPSAAEFGGAAGSDIHFFFLYLLLVQLFKENLKTTLDSSVAAVGVGLLTLLFASKARDEDRAARVARDSQGALDAEERRAFQELLKPMIQAGTLAIYIITPVFFLFLTAGIVFYGLSSMQILKKP